MKKEQTSQISLWRSLTVRMFAMVMLPLTLLSMVIAVGSVTLHQQQKREHLPEEAWKAATSPALELTLVAPLVLIPPLLFAVAGLWFVTKQIIQPVQKLESKAAALAWGNFEAIREPVGRISEIQHLQTELAEISRKVKAAQEEERTRLARELHDDTIQAVIALKQRVQLAQKSVKDQATRKSLKELETLSEQTIENLRRLTRALRPIYLEDLGLVTALSMLAHETSENHQIVVKFQKNGQERRILQEVELSLYRIAQEALNNVVKHAQATHAELKITFNSTNVQMEVSDNGNGFSVPNSPTEFAPKGHFGLLSIHERADLIGAKLEMKSTPGKGTRLTIQL